MNIEDHLSEEEIKRICEDELRDRIKGIHRNDFERILSNAAYREVSAMCDDMLDEDLKTTLKQNLKGVVTKLSHCTVFKAPNAWDREPNSAYEYLQQCIEQQKPRIKGIVEKQIEPQVIANLKEGINEAIEEAILVIYKEI